MPAALPAVPGLELESFFRPMAAGSEVGGDFYDVFGDRGDCWLVVGDVCGKGAEAAVLTGFLRHTTVAYARDGHGPATVLARVNQAMLDHDFDGRFATAILAHLGFRDSDVELTLATAGHPARARLARAAARRRSSGRAARCSACSPTRRSPSRPRSCVPATGSCSTPTGSPRRRRRGGVLSVEQMIDQLAGTTPASARGRSTRCSSLVDLRNGARDDIAILAAHVSAD